MNHNDRYTAYESNDDIIGSDIGHDEATAAFYGVETSEPEDYK